MNALPTTATARRSAAVTRSPRLMPPPSASGGYLSFCRSLAIEDAFDTTPACEATAITRSSGALPALSLCSDRLEKRCERAEPPASQHLPRTGDCPESRRGLSIGHCPTSPFGLPGGGAEGNPVLRPLRPRLTSPLPIAIWGVSRLTALQLLTPPRPVADRGTATRPPPRTGRRR
jgi:hypothetical protein